MEQFNYRSRCADAFQMWRVEGESLADSSSFFGVFPDDVLEYFKEEDPDGYAETFRTLKKANKWYALARLRSFFLGSLGN